jgi:phosphoenolpyruvate synthase/pyruvate phosphate dikinase
VVYSTAYALGASPKYLGYLGHPALLNFVVRVSETDHGKKGIKLSNEHTVSEKVDSMAGATTNTTTRGAQKLKPGIFARKLDGTKM